MKAFDRVYRRVATAAQRVLAARWPGAEVAVVDARPADGILGVAKRSRTRVIVMGSRARGRLARLLLGSVARTVVYRAPCAVLVVRGRSREFTRFVIGIDGSAGSRRAVDLVARLQVPRGGHVRLVAVVEPLRTPAMPPVPLPIRQDVAALAAKENARRLTNARRHLGSAERRLERTKWTVRTTVREGAPLSELLAAATEAEAHALVVGPRGVSGAERLLLGSVADGVLSHSPLPVLLVR
jgi:nucleotide-binding universal stress UspA family protein